jgi:hypothetical protein
VATSNGSLYRQLVSQLTSQSKRSQSVASASLSPGRSNEMRSVSVNERTVAQGIRFGSPSQTTTNTGTTRSQTNWTQLLGRAATGGVTSALGGGVASLGLSPIVSGILSLFQGEDKTPPPLTRFELPASQDRTITVGAAPTSTAQVSPAEVNTQWFLDRSNDIAKAVRSAMLNSSSINDVISEI